jgi:predicted CopG family antitoxin
MATKTLTITEEAYNILFENKLKSESFSDVIKRSFSKKRSKSLNEFFGIISYDEGNEMLNDLDKIKNSEIKLLSKRLK